LARDSNPESQISTEEAEEVARFGRFVFGILVLAFWLWIAKEMTIKAGIDDTIALMLGYLVIQFPALLALGFVASSLPHIDRRTSLTMMIVGFLLMSSVVAFRPIRADPTLFVLFTFVGVWLVVGGACSSDDDRIAYVALLADATLIILAGLIPSLRYTPSHIDPADLRLIAATGTWYTPIIPLAVISGLNDRTQTKSFMNSE